MTCQHLKELYELCRQNNLRLSSSDLIRIVCPHCGVEEVCPAVLCDEYDGRHAEDGQSPPKDGGDGGNRGD